MSSQELNAGTVMNASAALLNDAAKSLYTFAAQIPFLNLALQELQEIFQLNEVPVVDTTSAVITIPDGIDKIGFGGTNEDPKLPDDLIEPQILYERESGVDPYTLMGKLNSLPRQLEGTEISQFINYVWQSQEIRFLPANRDNDIKIDYIRDLFVAIVDENSVINVINAASFLEFRNAGLCAFFIGENKTRADDLNGFASLAIDRATGISTKGRQAIFTRRRPFRSAYKKGSYI